jgi:hypothetical protein
VQDAYARIKELRGEVVAVSFSAPSLLAGYLERNPLPFGLVADPERAAYRALGLDRTSWKEFFRPAVVLRYLRLMARGWLPWRGRRGDDLLQLGGDFVLDAARRLVYAHRSAEPTDRPAAEELVRAVASAATAAGDQVAYSSGEPPAGKT